MTIDLSLNVLSIILELVVYYFFFYNFFGKGKFSPLVMLLIYLALGGFSFYLTTGHPVGFIRRSGYLIVIWLLAICYTGNLFLRFFLPFLFQTISIMVEQCYAALLRPIREMLLSSGMYGQDMYYLLGILLSNFTVLLLVKLFASKKEYIFLNQDSIKFPLYALGLLIFPQSMAYSVNRLRELLLQSNDEKVNSVLTIIIALLTFFTIAYFFLFVIFVQYYQKRQENIILQKQVEQERLYHEILLGRHQQLQSLRHDMKHQFDTIAGLLAGGYVPDALAIAQNQSGKLAKTAVVQSGHPLVDTILTLKEEQAQQIGVNFQCHIAATIDAGAISADDLASLLGNILDNAIEAAAKLSRDIDKVIKCKLIQEKQYLYIIISNPVAEDIEIIDDYIATTKARKELHGYGLITIKNIVQKYGGRYHLKCTNKIFTIKIVLPVDMEEK